MDNTGKNRGIILHTIRYGENGVIVYMYTENSGRMSYFMRSNKNGAVIIGKNRVVLQPLAPIDFVVSSVNGSKNQYIKEAKRSFLTINSLCDIRKSTIILFISEFMYRVVKENTANPMLFDFVYHSIKALDALESGVSNFHVYFVVRIGQYLGFSPMTNYQENAFFDMMLGKYVITRPQHDKYFGQQDSYFLNLFQNTNLSNLSKIKMDRISRIDLLNNLMQYYEYHNETKYKMESLKILSEIF